jgi:hypothetical protein
MAPTNPHMAAKGIVHFALVDERGPTVASSDTKKQFNGERLVLL